MPAARLTENSAIGAYENVRAQQDIPESMELQAIYALVIGGVLMIVSGLATLLVDKSAEPG